MAVKPRFYGRRGGRPMGLAAAVGTAAADRAAGGE